MESSDTDAILREIQKFGYALAEFVTSWNRVERSLRLILNDLIGGTGETFIVVVEIGNRGLVNAIRSFTVDNWSAEDHAAMQHLLDFFERVLAHRNYLVHGILQIVFDNATKQAVGEIYTQSAKGRLVHHQEIVTLADVEARKAMVTNLAMAATWMHGHVENLVTQKLKNLPLSGFQSNFPLPDSPKKPRNFPLAK